MRNTLPGQLYLFLLYDNERSVAKKKLTGRAIALQNITAFQDAEEFLIKYARFGTILYAEAMKCRVQGIKSKINKEGILLV